MLGPAVAPPASAELQLCKDSSGKRTFSNTGDGSGTCSKSFPDRKPSRSASRKPSAGASKAATKTRKNYPKVSQSQQQRRDQTRLQILMDELQTESKAAENYSKQIQTAQLTEEERSVMAQILNNHILNIQALKREIQGIK